MDSKILKALGIDPALIFLFLLVLIVILFVLYVNVTMKYNRLKSSYTTFMRGKDGKTLEESMMSGFSDVEAILKYTKQNRTDIQKLNKKMEKSYQKVGIVKYDAFNEMGGKLSFALAMLDNNNTGWILNAMHSREGCYTYVKEIVKGESYVELAEEEAEALMGAKGWTIFSKITFPHIKWALLYGIVLCTARAMGEFGAVSVLSGHLRGLTNTLPLHVEILFNEFQYVPAFAVSSILVIMAIILLVIRSIMEYKGKKEEEA